MPVSYDRSCPIKHNFDGTLRCDAEEVTSVGGTSGVTERRKIKMLAKTSDFIPAVPLTRLDTS